MVKYSNVEADVPWHSGRPIPVIWIILSKFQAGESIIKLNVVSH